MKKAKKKAVAKKPAAKKKVAAKKPVAKKKVAAKKPVAKKKAVVKQKLKAASASDGVGCCATLGTYPVTK